MVIWKKFKILLKYLTHLYWNVYLKINGFWTCYIILSVYMTTHLYQRTLYYILTIGHRVIKNITPCIQSITRHSRNHPYETHTWMHNIIIVNIIIKILFYLFNNEYKFILLNLYKLVVKQSEKTYFIKLTEFIYLIIYFGVHYWNCIFKLNSVFLWLLS